MSLTKRLLSGIQRRGDPFEAIRTTRMGPLSLAGTNVSEEGSLRNTAVFACVRLISQSLASIPLIMYERRGRQRLRATNHPLYRVLHDQGNAEMTAFEVTEARLAAGLLWGNGYAEIEYDDQWQVRGIWPMTPAAVGVERNDAYELQYTYWNERLGRGFVLPAYRVLHLRYLIVRGAVGISPVRAAMNAIGLGNAIEEFGSRYFANGSRPSIILKHPKKLSPEAYERLRSSFEEQWAGLSDAHRINLLEEGVTADAIGIPPEEAQFLESRKYQVAEISRLYGVPLDSLGDNSAASYASVEQFGMNLRTYAFGSWATRDQQALQRDLLTEEERGRYYIEYLFDALERADISTRTQAYNTLRQIGAISANEIRERENMNPIAGGDSYWQPLNVVEANADGVTVETRAAPSTPERTARRGEQRAQSDDEIAKLTAHRQKLFRQYQPLFEDAATRLVNREVADIRRAVKKHLQKRAEGQRSVDEFRDWLAKFYADLREVIPDLFEATLRSLAEHMATDVAKEIDVEDPGYTDEMRTFVEEYLKNFAAGYTASGERQIKALLDAATADNVDPADTVGERLDGWEENRAKKTGRQQAFEGGNALVVGLYGAMGVQQMRWAARGDSCPFCKKMNGRIVGINESFVQGGEKVHGDDGAEPMLIRRTKRHGPLHGTCDCVVVAA